MNLKKKLKYLVISFILVLDIVSFLPNHFSYYLVLVIRFFLVIVLVIVN